MTQALQGVIVQVDMGQLYRRVAGAVGEDNAGRVEGQNRSRRGRGRHYQDFQPPAFEAPEDVELDAEIVEDHF